jgi:hypothetical protein
MGTSLMARVATNLWAVIEMILIDSHGHLHHFPGGGLFRLVVGGEVTLHMAEIAVLAEGEGPATHGVGDGGSGGSTQQLQVLEAA